MAERSRVALERSRELPARVFGRRPRFRGQHKLRTRSPRRTRIDEQRQDRMIVGRRGQLDPPLLGQPSIRGQYLGEQSRMQREQIVAMLRCDVAACDVGLRMRP
jgi:hypothetical protein